MDNLMSLRFASKLNDIKDINDSFAMGRLRVCYAGANQNGSFISRQAIEDAIPTMYNCPVVCNYDAVEDTIGGHDMSVITTADGDMRLINLTDAIGVIPQSALHCFETVVEDDGVEHEYFVTDAILWKRSPAFEKIARDGITAQSMEINVRDGRLQDNLYVINNFVFTAFCLLGEDVRPCFESASLQMFSRDELRMRYLEMMEDFKKSFQQVTTSIIEDDINTKPKGGEELLEQKMELLARFGLSVDGVEFDIESMSVEELETKLVEMSEQDSNDDGSDNSGDEAQFSLTGEQFIGELITALHEEYITTEWGTYPRYSYCDYSADLHEVYCYDTEDWRIYGFPYTMNGDKVVIDFTAKKRKKIAFEDFDEGDADIAFGAIFELAKAVAENTTSRLTTKFEAERNEFEEKYAAATTTIESMKTELDELRLFRQTKSDEERAAAEDAVFANFEDLIGVEAFTELQEHRAEYTLEELEEKCFAIRGRNTAVTFSANKQKTPRLPVERNAGENEPYGGLFIEFPPKR